MWDFVGADAVEENIQVKAKDVMALETKRRHVIECKQSTGEQVLISKGEREQELKVSTGKI